MIHCVDLLFSVMVELWNILLLYCFLFIYCWLFLYIYILPLLVLHCFVYFTCWSKWVFYFFVPFSMNHVIVIYVSSNLYEYNNVDYFIGAVEFDVTDAEYDCVMCLLLFNIVWICLMVTIFCVTFSF